MSARRGLSLLKLAKFRDPANQTHEESRHVKNNPASQIARKWWQLKLELITRYDYRFRQNAPIGFWLT